eukprot:TRINITY_DN11121_c0_g2_i1.p1 TRINITY_DN11121_c0_g2~~TRINITY_DN11121_c0_g2_i1.p1  ORF type:complete len:377 (+),score=125.39 TRINITY_DN11121_c0_g2_i1:128-1258(+)
METASLPQHKIYKLVGTFKEADAVARAFIDKKLTTTDYPFKFPDLKPYELRAKILFTGLCHTDIHLARSEWMECEYPVVPGHEVIAEITALGTDVSSLRVGQRIGFGFERWFCGECVNCKKKEDNLCLGTPPEGEGLYIQYPYFAGYSTHIQAPASVAIPIPESLPLDRAPPLLCAGITLWAPLVRWGFKGAKVGIIGIGGLGHMGVKFGAKLGYHITAFTTNPTEKGEEIRRMGAEEIAHSSNLEELAKLQGKFDVILNTAYYSKDSKLYNAWIALCRKGGAFVNLALPGAGEPDPQININYIVLNQINFVGSIIGSVSSQREMLEFAATHNILPDCEIFQWEDFPTAIDKCSKGTAKYRCVVDVQSFANKHSLH